jgi:PhnB protein
MSISFHINFNGDCEEAFGFYERVLDGKIGTLLKVKDSPVAQTFGEDLQEHIIHANISFDGVEIAGADIAPDLYQLPQGFCVLMSVQSEEKLREIFAELKMSGEVTMEPQQTFFSKCYAIVRDRYGVPWKLNCSDSVS